MIGLIKTYLLFVEVEGCPRQQTKQSRVIATRGDSGYAVDDENSFRHFDSVAIDYFRC